jgi:hypothetical protein
MMGFGGEERSGKCVLAQGACDGEGRLRRMFQKIMVISTSAAGDVFEYHLQCRNCRFLYSSYYLC